jgi:hypothetical protein
MEKLTIVVAVHFFWPQTNSWDWPGHLPIHLLTVEVGPEFYPRGCCLRSQRQHGGAEKNGARLYHLYFVRESWCSRLEERSTLTSTADKGKWMRERQDMYWDTACEHAFAQVNIYLTYARMSVLLCSPVTGWMMSLASEGTR